MNGKKNVRINVDEKELANLLQWISQNRLKKAELLTHVFQLGLKSLAIGGYSNPVSPFKTCCGAELANQDADDSEYDDEDDDEPAKEDQIELRHCATCYRPSIVDAGNVCPNCGTVNEKW